MSDTMLIENGRRTTRRVRQRPGSGRGDLVLLSPERRLAALRLAGRHLPRGSAARVGARERRCGRGLHRPRLAPGRARPLFRVFSNRARGLLGMEIGVPRRDLPRCADPDGRRQPRLQAVLDRFLERRNADVEGFAAEGALRAFSARQFLVTGSAPANLTELFRGAPLVAPTASIDPDRAANLADGIGRWMVRSLSADGALPYKYWPSRAGIARRQRHPPLSGIAVAGPSRRAAWRRGDPRRGPAPTCASI